MIRSLRFAERRSLGFLGDGQTVGNLAVGVRVKSIF